MGTETKGKGDDYYSHTIYTIIQGTKEDGQSNTRERSEANKQQYKNQSSGTILFTYGKGTMDDLEHVPP